MQTNKKTTNEGFEVIVIDKHQYPVCPGEEELPRGQRPVYATYTIIQIG